MDQYKAGWDECVLRLRGPDAFKGFDDREVTRGAGGGIYKGSNEEPN
jgi:hypothetical protein